MPDTTVTVTAGMPTTVTVTGGVADVTIDVLRGATGATGAAGPNTVTTSTTTNITGIIQGNGSVVSQAIAGTDYAAALGVNDNYVTDAQLVVIGNTSGTNTGDQFTSVTSQRLIGRHAGSSGAAQEVQVGDGIEFQGSGIRRSALTGDITATAGSNATTLASTIAGDKTLSGQLELTGQAATNKTSAMTKDLVVIDRHVNSIRRMAFAVPTVFSTGGGTSSVSGDMASLNIASAAAGSIRGASFMDGSPHSVWSGAMMNFARPFIASGVFYLRNLTADTTCLRFLIGGAASYLANANAFSANGLGIEIKQVTSVGYRARLVYYSSTLVGGVAVGYVETAFADFGVGAGSIYGRSNAFVITNDGLGTVNLYIQSYADIGFTTTKPPVSLTTPLITITNAPKAAASGSAFTASLATTAADAAGVQVETKVRALQFDYNS